MISGVIAEFNPFHNGHRYLLSQVSGLKVVMMSGNWMQRGEPAIVDKWVRAQMALENGADIVCELPFFASVQSADYFADYAIKLLASLGVEQLVFGTDTEAIDYEKLKVLYQTQHKEMADFIASLPDSLSYPQKTQKMWETFAAIRFDGNTPNHILALAYAKAVATRCPQMKLHAIERIGAGFHDQTLSTFASATAIRLHANDVLSDVMPNFALFQAAPKVQWSDYFALLSYKITSTDITALTQIFQVNEELAVRLKKAIKEVASFDELVSQVATKRYTHARVRRILTYILVNVSEHEQFRQVTPRILGFSSAGQAHLKSCDVITKVGKNYEDTLTLKADDVYRLGNPQLLEQNYGRRPIIMK